MRLIGLGMVRNEADIIEQFARHNLTFLDALFLYDNDSVDGTREILVALQREGLAIVIADDPHLAYMQAEKMTALYRNACEYAAPNYAFLLDADEFIVAPSRHALEQDLAQVPTGTAGALGWTTYLYAADESEPDPLRRMLLRRRQERPRYYKVVVKCDPRECQHISITQGNHDVTHDLLGMLPHHVLSNAHLAHFPVRSATQITSKGIGGWLAYLAKDPEAAKYDAGYQWRHVYERFLDNPVLTFRDLEEMSLNYAQPGQQDVAISRDNAVFDPLKVSHVLRYSSLGRQDPLIIVARTFERHLTGVHNHSIYPTPVPAGQLGTSMIEQSGAWTAQLHYEHLFLDLPPFRYMWDKYQPASVLDVGCGLGGYVRMFKNWGVSCALGLDGSSVSEAHLSPEDYRTHDLREPLELGQRYDLVICTEVLEHIDAQYEQIAIATVTRHARDVIVFSAADEGQPGIGHVNCHRISYWLTLWQQRGWVPDVFDSLAIRSLATFSWFRHNLVVLKRMQPSAVKPQSFDMGDLARLAEYQFAWYGQPPAIHTVPYTEPLPSLYRLVEATR